MKTILPALFLMLCLTLQAQNIPSWRLHLQGYNVLHSGLELAWEYPILHKVKTNKKDKDRIYQLLLAPTFDFYHQKDNHTGLSLNGEVILKTIGSKGMEFQLYGGAGGIQTILAGEVYEMDSNGDFSSSKLKGNLHRHWKVGFGFGYNLFTTKEKPYAVSFRAGIRQLNLPASPITPSLGIGVNYYFLKNKTD